MINIEREKINNTIFIDRYHITKCKPFVFKSSGELAHRPRYAQLINSPLCGSYFAVTYWCGNRAVSKGAPLVFAESAEGKKPCKKCANLLAKNS